MGFRPLDGVFWAKTSFIGRTTYLKVGRLIFFTTLRSPLTYVWCNLMVVLITVLLWMDLYESRYLSLDEVNSVELERSRSQSSGD